MFVCFLTKWSASFSLCHYIHVTVHIKNRMRKKWKIPEYAKIVSSERAYLRTHTSAPKKTLLNAYMTSHLWFKNFVINHILKLHATPTTRHNMYCWGLIVKVSVIRAPSHAAVCGACKCMAKIRSAYNQPTITKLALTHTRLHTHTHAQFQAPSEEEVHLMLPRWGAIKM